MVISSRTLQNDHIMRKSIGLAFMLLMSACNERQIEAPLYESATVKYASIAVGVASAGIVEPLSTVEVKSKASGEVLDTLVAIGDRVEEGALIVRIDPRTVNNRLAQAKAELKAALSRKRISETQWKRAESLVKNGTFTETEHEQAALELANAEALVVSSEVSVENAQIAVDDTEIRAPVTGTVIEKTVEKGQVISSPTQDVGGGTLLLKMANLSEVQIRALVDETDIGKIRPGMPALITVAAYPNQPFTGQVQKVEPQAVVDQNVTMFAVLISIRNPDGLLMPGMNAEVDIAVATSKDALTIPVMALRTDRDISATAGILDLSESDIAAVINSEDSSSTLALSSSDYQFGGKFWVVVKNGNEHKIVNVRTGITDLDDVEITAGLNENDEVLLLPSAHLVETQERLQRYISHRIGGVPGIGSKD